MSRRARNKEETRRRILAAARELFDDRGYEQTTTREIAARAGIAAGTLFNYYREKRELAQELFQRELDAVVEQAFDGSPGGGPLVDELMQVFTRLYAHYQCDPERARVYLRELTFPPREGKVRFMLWNTRFLQRLGQIIEHAQRRGELRADLVPFLAAEQAFAIYFFVLLAWLHGAVPVALRDTQLREQLGLMVRGIS